MARDFQRFRQLDAVRGLAALIVVLHHCLLAYPTFPHWIDWTPLRLLHTGGEGAVLVFFALSGFVLFLTFVHKDGQQFLPFFVKRLARIYLPFCFAIVFAVALLLVAPPKYVPQASAWLASSWPHISDFHIVLEHLAMTDRLQWQAVDNVMWSLVHELRISLLFPIIALAIMIRWRLTVVSSIVIATAANIYWWKVRPDLTIDIVSTLKYLAIFVVSATIAYKHDLVRSYGKNIMPGQSAAGWLIGCCLITIPGMRLGCIPASAGAILLLSLAVADPQASRFLINKACLWLGKISYSLYLIHLPIIAACARIFSGSGLFSLSLLIGILISLVVAHLCHRFVENPCQRLGRWLADLLTTERLQIA